MPLTSFPGDELSPALSSDGKQVAFAWNGQDPQNFDIYVMQVGSATPLRLTTSPASEDDPAWAPDGTHLAFTRSEAKGFSLWLISALGGPERKVIDLGASPSHLGWTPDGRHLVLDVPLSDATDDVIRVDVGSSEVNALLSTPRTEGRYQFPVVSPDGKYLAFTYASGPIGIGAGLHVVSLSAAGMPTGEPRQLTNVPTGFDGISWSSDGRSLVYAAAISQQLWRLPLTGTPERLLTGIAASTPSLALTRARLAYVTGTVNSDLVRAEPGGEPVPFGSSTFEDYDAQLSPDGAKISFVSSRSGDVAIWVANADGSNAVRLTQEAGRRPGSPHWSPDGRRIVYDTQEADGHSRIFVIDAAGGRPRRLITTTNRDDEALPTWSRDGKSIYFRSVTTGRNEIWKASADGGAAVQVTRVGGTAAWESWDGQTLYYTRGGAARQLLAMPVQGGAERRVLDAIFFWFYLPVRDGIYFIARPEPFKLYRYRCGFTTAPQAQPTRSLSSRLVRCDLR